MSHISIRFCVDPKLVQANGTPCAMEASLVDAVELVQRMVEADRFQLDANYLFVIDGMIWNTQNRPLYVPTCSPVGVYMAASALAFLETVVEYIGVTEEFCAIFSETVQIQFLRSNAEELTLQGLDFDNTIVYPPVTVSVRYFLSELTFATNAAIELLDQLLVTLSTQTSINQKLLERFRWINQPEKWFSMRERLAISTALALH